ncbi:MAG: hypothetical protein ACRD2I_01775 [Vicinamibacterales bacterium]
MTGHEQNEYKALRETIRERGTARVCIFVAGISIWAATTIATAALAATPVATLLPLLVLASAFEGVFALHVGVERVGRYIQVFYEPDEAAAAPGGAGRWEHTAMAFGRPAGAPTTDALFTVPFLLAGLCNAAPVMLLHPVREELLFVGGAHALFVLRIVVARLSAGRQRAIDLQRFTQLRESRR